MLGEPSWVRSRANVGSRSTPRIQSDIGSSIASSQSGLTMAAPPTTTVTTIVAARNQRLPSTVRTNQGASAGRPRWTWARDLDVAGRPENASVWSRSIGNSQRERVREMRTRMGRVDGGTETTPDRRLSRHVTAIPSAPPIRPETMRVVARASDSPPGANLSATPIPSAPMMGDTYRNTIKPEAPEHPIWERDIFHSLGAGGRGGLLVPYHEYLASTGDPAEDRRRHAGRRSSAPSATGRRRWGGSASLSAVPGR